MCSPSRAGRRKMTTVSLLSPTPSPVVSARRPPHHGGHGRHDGRRERGQDGTGQPVDASHAGLLLLRRREICPYNVKSIAPVALFRARITSRRLVPWSSFAQATAAARALAARFRGLPLAVAPARRRRETARRNRHQRI